MPLSRRCFVAVAVAALSVPALGCSGDAAESSATAPDAGKARSPRDGGFDAMLAPPTPSTPTLRCENPQPSLGVYVPPPVDAGAPIDAGTLDATDANVPDGDPIEGGVDAGPPLVSTPVRYPQVISSGGPVLPMPRWIPVFFRDTEDIPDIEDFLGSIGCTRYWRAIANDFGVGDGISAPSVIVGEDGPDAISDAQIQKWLVARIKDKTLEAPTPNSVYTIFYPGHSRVSIGSERSCRGFGGYHNDAQMPDGTLIAYAVMPRCGSFAELTSTTSHELIEAATDPYPASDPAYQTPANEDIAWGYVAGGEVADICTFIDGSQVELDEYPYTVQRSFSNKASFEGRDPCVPATRAYFYAAPSLETSVTCDECGDLTTYGVHVPAGTSKTITVTLGADPGVTAFAVRAVDGASLPLQFGTTSSSFYSLDKDRGAPGDQLRLTIAAWQNAKETEIFALEATYLGRRNYWYALVTH